MVATTTLLSEFIKLPELFYNLNPVYFHLFMIGWVNQLIFGVAWWLFPILPLNKNQDQKKIKFLGILLTENLKENEPYKGNKYLAWSLYFSLNFGLILRAVFEPYNTINRDNFSAFCLLASAIIQVYSAFCFVFLLWRRVRYKK